VALASAAVIMAHSFGEPEDVGAVISFRYGIRGGPIRIP
jgi:hypothetical protein